jgi:hypothetical protein
MSPTIGNLGRCSNLADPFRTFERVSGESLHGRSGVPVGAHYGCNYLVALARERPLAARHPPTSLEQPIPKSGQDRMGLSR